MAEDNLGPFARHMLIVQRILVGAGDSFELRTRCGLTAKAIAKSVRISLTVFRASTATRVDPRDYCRIAHKMRSQVQLRVFELNR